MSERPHWDDYLIMAVGDAIQKADPASYPTLGMVSDVIAAVEDWHRDRWTGVCESPEEVVRELKQAQAAIQRVRELHRTVVDEVFADFGWDGEVEHCQECGYVPTDDEPCPTLAALEYRHVESSNPRTLTETPDRHESPGPPSTLAVTDILLALDGPDE